MKTTSAFLLKPSFYRLSGTFSAIIILVCFLTSCSLLENKQKEVINTSTIIFVDKSGSVSVKKSVRQKNNEILSSIIAKKAVNAGDEIIVSFIYEQTSNRSNQYVFAYSPPTLDVSGKSSNEARLAKIKHKQRLRAYNKHFSSKVVDKAFSILPSRKQTDVIGSIKKLSDLTSLNSKRDYFAFYFSDMIEFSDFRQMYFGENGNSINSFTEAQSLAKKDTPLIVKKLDLQKNCLSGISEISIIFPSDIMHINQAFSFLPEYWSYIFKHLGVKNINYL